MKEKFWAIIGYITGIERGHKALSDINIPEQFQADERDGSAVGRNLNAAFLIALAGESHARYKEAVEYLNHFEAHPSWGEVASFYKSGLSLIHSEIADRYDEDEEFKESFDHLYSWVTEPENLKRHKETVEKIRQVFFPEGVGVCDNRDERIKELREKRRVKILRPNPSPIKNPVREILFTSNVLITTPLASKEIDELALSPSLKQILRQVVQEEQMYWYDHPIPVGIEPEHNEIIYGLEGLDRAVAFEKDRKTIGQAERLTCLLSVSVTHKGLQEIAKKYLEDELRRQGKIQHLNIYVFTEEDTRRLLEEVLIPAAGRYTDLKDHESLYKVIGVDGEYGRHYSFLKAIAAFWQVLIDPEIKGTFKIDLDQVFPQKELVEQTGASAFEHFKTPLWGAEGIDSEGEAVELGMVAGALVNKKDIEYSLFSPDVCFPPEAAKGDELIFFSRLPQALSTEAEMMTRYTDSILDGKNNCLQRIHVTGGICGILISSLRRYRPFTPTFIGRAEDQAYILSVLFSNTRQKLRYLHKDGLIMRHDKEAFAGEAIKMAATGKLLGDYLRILLFSYYCRALPWSLERIKDAIDPFTGCFVSKIPVTIVYLRFALKTASLFNDRTGERGGQALEFLQAGGRRLYRAIQKLTKEPCPLIEQFKKEQGGWKAFYDILDTLERSIKEDDSYALELKERAISIVNDCRIRL